MLSICRGRAVKVESHINITLKLCESAGREIVDMEAKVLAQIRESGVVSYEQEVISL
jgi:hypothetical protein